MIGMICDRCHSMARLFTSLGFGNGFFRVLGRGATAVTSSLLPTPRAVIGTVRRGQVTVLTAVPTFWAQLARFLADPANRGRVMDRGLWRSTRHPNYFGELLCWWGVFVFAAGSYAGAAWIGVTGPVAITWILLRVTGIPTLEASAAKKWGTSEGYQAHVQRTSRLIPWPPRAH